MTEQKTGWDQAQAGGKKLVVLHNLVNAVRNLRAMSDKPTDKKIAAFTQVLLALDAVDKLCPACTWGEFPHRNCVMR